MKPSNAFKEAIKNHLEKLAQGDELFAETYKKENKSIEECCDYVMQCAKKGGCTGYTDEEVFGWAVHYYDEDDIKDIKPISGKVVVNHAAAEVTEKPQTQKKSPIRKQVKVIVEQVDLFS